LICLKRALSIRPSSSFILQAVVAMANLFCNDSSLRSGKWTAAEEEYAHEIVKTFVEGSISDVEKGKSLRGYLAQKLRTNVKRISKKFEGTNYSGKRIYVDKTDSLNKAVVAARQRKLKDLEAKFIESVKFLEKNEADRKRPMDVLTNSNHGSRGSSSGGNCYPLLGSFEPPAAMTASASAIHPFTHAIHLNEMDRMTVTDSIRWLTAANAATGGIPTAATGRTADSRAEIAPFFIPPFDPNSSILMALMEGNIVSACSALRSGFERGVNPSFPSITSPLLNSTGFTNNSDLLNQILFQRLQQRQHDAKTLESLMKARPGLSEDSLTGAAAARVTTTAPSLSSLVSQRDALMSLVSLQATASTTSASMLSQPCVTTVTNNYCGRIRTGGSNLRNDIEKDEQAGTDALARKRARLKE